MLHAIKMEINLGTLENPREGNNRLHIYTFRPTANCSLGKAVLLDPQQIALLVRQCELGAHLKKKLTSSESPSSSWYDADLKPVLFLV